MFRRVWWRQSKSGIFFVCFHEIHHENSLGEEESDNMMEAMEINEFCIPSGLGSSLGQRIVNVGMVEDASR